MANMCIPLIRGVYFWKFSPLIFVRLSLAPQFSSDKTQRRSSLGFKLLAWPYLWIIFSLTLWSYLSNRADNLGLLWVVDGVIRPCLIDCYGNVHVYAHFIFMNCRKKWGTKSFIQGLQRIWIMLSLWLPVWEIIPCAHQAWYLANFSAIKCFVPIQIML